MNREEGGSRVTRLLPPRIHLAALFTSVPHRRRRCRRCRRCRRRSRRRRRRSSRRPV